MPGEPAAADLNVAVESVLLEAMRRRDEAGRGAS